MSLDLSKLSSKELKELLAKKREEEHQTALKKREAYEGIRAELVQRVENKGPGQYVRKSRDFISFAWMNWGVRVRSQNTASFVIPAK